MNTVTDKQGFEVYVRLITLLATQNTSPEAINAATKALTNNKITNVFDFVSFVRVLSEPEARYSPRVLRITMGHLLTNDSFLSFWKECEKLVGYTEIKMTAKVYEQQYPDVIHQAEKSAKDLFKIARECDEIEKHGYVFVTPSLFNTPAFQREFCGYISRYEGVVKPIMSHAEDESRTNLLVEGFLVERFYGVSQKGTLVYFEEGRIMVDVNPIFGTSLGPFFSGEKYYELCVKKGTVFN